MRLRRRAPIASSPRYGKRWNRSSMPQKEAAAADLEGKTLAPAVALLAAAGGDTVMEHKADRRSDSPVVVEDNPEFGKR